jgi:hypothetical protein
MAASPAFHGAVPEWDTSPHRAPSARGPDHHGVAVLKNRVLGATVALFLAATSVGLGATAAQADDDDRITVSGYASKDARYALTLGERDDDRVRTSLKIDSTKAGKKWTVSVYRNGKKVAQTTKRTARNGDATFVKTVRGDDDDTFRVVARSGYGERLTRTVDLDDDLESRSGTGTKSTRYGYTVQERDDDRATAEVRVNGTKKNATWTVTFYRDGTKVASHSQRANGYGNLTVARTFAADDDDRVRVVAKSGYGAQLSRTIDLDD